MEHEEEGMMDDTTLDEDDMESDVPFSMGCSADDDWICLDQQVEAEFNAEC